MGLSNTERQARFRAKRDAELKALREAQAQQKSTRPLAAELIEARKEISALRKQLARYTEHRAIIRAAG